MGNPIDSLSYLSPQVMNPSVNGDNVAKALRGLRDGTLSFAEFKLVCALEGILFECNVGSAATPVAGHVGVSMLQPEFNLDVPAGTTAIILPPNIYADVMAGTVTRLILSSINQLMGAGTSAALTAALTSVRADRKKKSACTGLQAYSANATALGNGVTQVEHWRSGYAFADAAGGPIKQFSPPLDVWPWPVLVGPASFQAYWFATTTAPSAFGQFSHIEFGSERVA